VPQPAPSAVGVPETDSSPRTIPVGIIMNGVTGRMGSNQHLARSIAQIREEGGVSLPDGRRILPEPVLVGRNADRLEELARQHGLESWTTELDEVLSDPAYSVYFDALATSRISSSRQPILAWSL